ncbi:hypothetical protein PBI_SCTP2_203 [Salicola phage SCTP-2]|nr:hypothetical protein PBI_SCTP2_203 [Salicola phage SCTP-2]
MDELDKLRQKLQNNPANQEGQRQNNSNGLYPFWNTPVDTTVTLRFLPDADEDNIMFWRERQIISIPFASVEGHPEMEDVIVQVPCVKMYGKNEKCPINEETKAWWKTDKEDYARRYWPKKTYLYQGFVRSSGFDEENPPENPIRRFVMNKNIHSMIEASILDPEMEHMPTDYDNGTDFKIVKRQGPKYADYSTSSFARKESPLTDDERKAIDEFGLYDLGSFLPKRPTEDELNVMYQMFVESLKDSQSVFRLEWANYYRPRGVDLDMSKVPNAGASESLKGNESVANVTTESTQKSEPEPEPEPEPAQKAPEPEADNGGGSDTDDIVAQLKNRINK